MRRTTHSLAPWRRNTTSAIWDVYRRRHTLRESGGAFRVVFSTCFGFSSDEHAVLEITKSPTMFYHDHSELPLLKRFLGICCGGCPVGPWSSREPLVVDIDIDDEADGFLPLSHSSGWLFVQRLTPSQSSRTFWSENEARRKKSSPNLSLCLAGIDFVLLVLRFENSSIVCSACRASRTSTKKTERTTARTAASIGRNNDSGASNFASYFFLLVPQSSPPEQPDPTVFSPAFLLSVKFGCRCRRPVFVNNAYSVN